MAVRIEGVDELHADLNEMAEKHPVELTKAARGTLRKMERTAKSLGSSLWVKRPQVSVPAISVTETSSGGYLNAGGRGGFFQEVGTVNHPPKPVIQPSIDAHVPAFWEQVERIMDK